VDGCKSVEGELEELKGGMFKREGGGKSHREMVTVNDGQAATARNTWERLKVVTGWGEVDALGVIAR
jgi:hypothetical protein